MPDDSLGCEGSKPDLRCGVAAVLLLPSSASCSVFHVSNSASAAAIVGSSRLAGVAVLDRDRLVDLPKDPFSATARRGRWFGGPPSWLLEQIERLAYRSPPFYAAGR